MKEVARIGSMSISPMRYQIKRASTKEVEGTISRIRGKKQTLVFCMSVKNKQKNTKKTVQKEGV